MIKRLALALVLTAALLSGTANAQPYLSFPGPGAPPGGGSGSGVTSVTCGSGLSGGTITTTGTCAFAGSAASQTSPASPAAPASNTVFSMQGLAGSVTPLRSGTLLVYATGTLIDTTTLTANTGILWTLSWGTGAAPANGDALTGVQCARTDEYTFQSNITAAADVHVPVTATCLVTGLTVGTTYWLDLAAERANSLTGLSFANTTIGAIEP